MGKVATPAKATTKAPTAAKTPKPTITKLKYAMNPPTVERFFAKAQASGTTVTILTHDAKTHENVLPIAKTEAGYKVKNGRILVIPAPMVKRLEYVQEKRGK